MRFKDTPPIVEQPALTENLLVLHMGSAKRVRRKRGFHANEHIVEPHRVTIIPAFESNVWQTDGTVDYAHLTLSTGFLAEISVQEFGCDPRKLALVDRTALNDPVLAAMFEELLATADADPARLYQETLLLATTLRVLRHYSTVGAEGQSARALVRGGLTPWQMRRIVDYLAENLDQPIGIDDLIALVGLSRAQFFRAFRQSTGVSPHRYVTNERLARARQLLAAGSHSIEEVAHAVGLGTASQFAALFRNVVGIPPERYASMLKA